MNNITASTAKVELVEAGSGTAVGSSATRNTALIVPLGAVLGFIGFLLLVPTPVMEIMGQLLVSSVFFLLSGVLIGNLARSRWPLAGIAAWGGVALVAASVIYGQIGINLAVDLLLASAVPLLLGGYLGSLIARRRRAVGRRSP